MFFSALVPLVGLDLGTSRTRIWSDRLDTVIDEATCVAVEQDTNKVIAIGNEALAMSGRVGGSIAVYFPLQQGELADQAVAFAFLRVLLQRVFSTFSLFRPVVMVSVPAGLSPAKREVVSELLQQLGAHEVLTIAQPLAAAIGAGVPIADSSGSFLLQLGGGVAEAAIISLGSVVMHESNTAAGNWLSERLIKAIKEQFGLTISRETVTQLHQSVTTLDQSFPREFLVSGQDVSTAAPKEIIITGTSVYPVVLTAAQRWESLLKRVLSAIPPELTTDVIDKGVLLSGGLGQLHGLESYLVQSLGVPVSVVERPAEAVVQGLRTALQNLDEFKGSLGYLHT